MEEDEREEDLGGGVGAGALSGLEALGPDEVRLGAEDRPDRGAEDVGLHTVCVVTTSAFLAFSKAHGNDLSTAMPQYGFPGLKPGDRWCLCAARWKEALDGDAAPHVVLEAPHAATLRVVSLDELKKYAFKPN